MADATHGDFTCPSAQCQPGSLLLGIRGADGRIGYLSPPLPVTAEFVEQVHSNGRDPERTLRFAGSCAGSGCAQWNRADSRCGVADVIATVPVPEPGGPVRLPTCGIRSTCRWFAQHGPAICQRCPVVTRTPLLHAFPAHPEHERNEEMSEKVAEPTVTIEVDDKIAASSAETAQQIKDLLHDTSVKVWSLLVGAAPKPDPDKLEVQDVDGEEVAVKWTVQLQGSTTTSPQGQSNTIGGSVSVTFG